MDQVGVLGSELPRGERSCGPWRARSMVDSGVRVALAAVFLMASAAKIMSPSAPALALEAAQLPLVSRHTFAIVGLMAGFEFGLAVWLLVARSPRLTAIIGLAGVALFTIYLAVLLYKGANVSCGCMGTLFSRMSPKQEITAGLIRNAGLLSMLAWLACRTGVPRGFGLAPTPTATPRAARSRPAFTIVEVMVSISVIAILVALLLPALTRVHAQAKVTRALAGIRQVHAATTLYANDNNDALPYIATPHRPWEIIVVRGTPLRALPYFRQGTFALSLVAPEYLDNPSALLHTNPERVFSDGVIASRYVMTCTAFASPPFWRGINPPDDLRLYTGSRLSDVAYPSAKGLWLDYETSLFLSLARREGEYGPWVIGRADASAATDPYDPAYQQPFIRSYGAVPIPAMMTTIDGLAGRDF